MIYSDGGSLIVLVVDDDATTRRLTERTLAKWGYRAMAVEDGARAWEIVQTLPVHIVLTDWEMPEMDGLELCRRVRARSTDRYTYILMLTQHVEQDRLVKALEAGADDFVTKPFQPLELQARLKAASRILTLERELRRSHRRLEEVNLELSHQATTDALMGVGNRRSFDEALSSLHERAIRERAPYGLALADVDHFKQYNDTYGHPAGDKVLSTLGRLLQDLIRGGDDVFRYGGEEIAILLPRCNGEGVRTVGERIRKAVASVGISHVNALRGVVTVSVGGAVFDPRVVPVLAAEDVLRRADEALYTAKAMGRDRVVVHAEAERLSAPPR